MKPTHPRFDELDQQMTTLFWDAETIVRDGQTTAYSVFPSEPRDTAVAATIGGTIVSQVRNAVLVRVNNTEEN